MRVSERHVQSVYGTQICLLVFLPAAWITEPGVKSPAFDSVPSRGNEDRF